MKKIFLIIIPLLLLNISFGIYSTKEKIDYLKNLNIDFDKKLLDKKQVSRYEVTRYLNYARCFDCLYPPQNIKEKLNLNWFENFKKQDRFYLNDIKITNKYYYCVTNLASLDYIHGYPKTNPICGGDFCGTNNMYLGELLQVVVNIISDKILNNYKIDNIDTFYNNMMSIKGTNDQTKVNILDSDYNIVEKIKNSGQNPYTIQNFKEFYLYQKYCDLFPEDCNFKEFGNIKKGSYLLSLINILYKENLLTLKEALNINPTKVISGEDLLTWLFKIKQINTCNIDNDYDKDGILNKDDNCIYTYNPSQKDTDKDGIGDVCDPDIDGDGVGNAIGVVDDAGNIIASKNIRCKNCKDTEKCKPGNKICLPCSKENCTCDNCIFTPNPEQKDINNNGIGDACENKGEDLIGIKIVCSPLVGYAPLDTKCLAKTTGPVKKVVWTYDGNIIGEGESISYTFLKKGDKKITATAIGENNDTALANSSFKVSEKENKNGYEVGLQIKANPTYGPEGTKVTFTKEIRGELDKIRWHFGDGSVYTKDPKINPIKQYPKQGYYKVLAEGIKNNKVVAKSYEYVKIYKRYKKLPTSYLKANPLEGYINQDIKFDLVVKNIKKEDVLKVVWTFGDNTNQVTKTLYTKHNYKTIGAFPVKATIYLKDGTKLENMITEKIIDNKILQKYGASMLSNPLRQYIGKKVDFTIIPKGFSIKDVKKINWFYGDGTKFENNSFKSNHTYYKQGKKYVTANITLNNEEVVTTSLTEVIIGKNICENLEQSKKTFKCDMDKDGIPDICDDDIDGDGVKNLIGLILYDKKDCSIDNENTDPTRRNEEKELAKKGGDIDNCSFTQNPEQEDKNINGIGDICENECIDSDNDGICDDQDTCPEIPENINGIEDLDGCPEINEVPTTPQFKVDNCNTCPCQFADYVGPFVPGAIIKAILVDPNNPNRFYTISQGVQY